jgi:hypothetical protein
VPKRPKSKAILRLPDLEQSKNAVLHSLGATPRLCLGGIFLAIFDGFELDRHRVHHIDDRLHLEFEYCKDARNIMNVGGIVCLDDHIAAVITNPDHKLVDRETRGHFVVFVEDLQYALMRGFLVFLRMLPGARARK